MRKSISKTAATGFGAASFLAAASALGQEIAAGEARPESVPMDGAVAIVVPVAFFAMLVLMVFLPLYMRNRRRAVDAQLQRKAIEAGMQFIPQLPPPPPRPRHDKRTGVIVAGLGVALAVPLALIGRTEIAVFGLAPVILGLAYFLVGAFLPSPPSSK